MLKKAQSWVAAVMLRVVYGLWSATWRVVHRDEPRIEGSVLYAHWHGDELALIGPFSRRGMAVLVSKSRDGEMLQRLLGWLGYAVVRGSSSRGAVEGLKGLVDEVLAGRGASLAVDGPRGPRGVVKAGLLKLAQLTGRPIVPGVVVCKHAWVFKNTWNRCFIPYPGSTLYVQYGKAVWVPAKASGEELDGLRREVENTLHDLKRLALERLHLPKPFQVTDLPLPTESN